METLHAGQGRESALAQFELMPEAKRVFEAGKAEIAAQVGERLTGREDMRFLEDLLAQLVVERSVRAQELQSDAVQRAAETAATLHGEKVFTVDCMDRRTSPTIARGHPGVPRVGGAHRTEGSRVQLTDDGLFAPFDPLRLKMTQAVQGGNHTQVFDAHVGCVAQETLMLEKERIQGTPIPIDKGLLENVREKTRYANAVRREFPDIVLPIVESFDPHSGTAWQFLEGSSVSARIAGEDPSGQRGLDDGMRERLAREGLVISSHRLAERLATTKFPQLVSAAVEELAGRTDLRIHYPQVMHKFWETMEEAWGDPAIRSKVADDLRRVAAENGTELSERENAMRAKLLLESALQQGIQTKDSRQAWPYQAHDEQFVLMTDSSDAGPYRTAAFLETGENPDQLPTAMANIIASVIRKARSPKDRPRPILAVNVATLRSDREPGDVKVALTQRIGRRYMALQASEATARMLDWGDLVIVNGFLGPQKDLVGVIPVASRT